MEHHAMDNSTDYLKFYDDEHYLLTEVGKCFRTTGELKAADLYMIFIWKANRAKNYHRDRLKRLVSTDCFQDAVDALASSLRECVSEKGRLEVLMNRWGFQLATASAILTILYPDEFTVYDYRVRRELGLTENLAQHVFSGSLWSKYVTFREKVKSETPSNLCLRDKDRFLTGRSFRKEVEHDCIE
jgi:hypothetical protein